MSAQGCPEIEALFDADLAGHDQAIRHAADCSACSALREEHRQLEKDLFRLADPLPPPDFVQSVLARVQAEPPPMRAELQAGVAILAVALTLGMGLFLASGGSAGDLGARLATLLADLQTGVLGLGFALAAAWKAAAVPLTLACGVAFLVCLLALGRLTPALDSAKVS